MDDFSNYPESMTEIKGNKSQNGAKWTPRDALVSLLRAIDRGEANPDALVIAYRTKREDGNTFSHYYQACPDHHTAIGVLEAAKFKLQTS